MRLGVAVLLVVLVTAFFFSVTARRRRAKSSVRAVTENEKDLLRKEILPALFHPVGKCTTSQFYACCRPVEPLTLTSWLDSNCVSFSSLKSSPICGAPRHAAFDSLLTPKERQKDSPALVGVDELVQAGTNGCNSMAEELHQLCADALYEISIGTQDRLKALSAVESMLVFSSLEFSKPRQVRLPVDFRPKKRASEQEEQSFQERASGHHPHSDPGSGFGLVDRKPVRPKPHSAPVKSSAVPAQRDPFSSASEMRKFITKRLGELDPTTVDSTTTSVEAFEFWSDVWSDPYDFLLTQLPLPMCRAFLPRNVGGSFDPSEDHPSALIHSWEWRSFPGVKNKEWCMACGHAVESLYQSSFLAHSLPAKHPFYINGCSSKDPNPTHRLCGTIKNDLMKHYGNMLKINTVDKENDYSWVSKGEFTRLVDAGSEIACNVLSATPDYPNGQCFGEPVRNPPHATIAELHAYVAQKINHGETVVDFGEKVNGYAMETCSCQYVDSQRTVDSSVKKEDIPKLCINKYAENKKTWEEFIKVVDGIKGAESKAAQEALILNLHPLYEFNYNFHGEQPWMKGLNVKDENGEMYDGAPAAFNDVEGICSMCKTRMCNLLGRGGPVDQLFEARSKQELNDARETYFTMAVGFGEVTTYSEKIYAFPRGMSRKTLWASKFLSQLRLYEFYAFYQYYMNLVGHNLEMDSLEFLDPDTSDKVEDDGTFSGKDVDEIALSPNKIDTVQLALQDLRGACCPDGYDEFRKYFDTAFLHDLKLLLITKDGDNAIQPETRRVPLLQVMIRAFELTHPELAEERRQRIESGNTREFGD